MAALRPLRQAIAVSRAHILSQTRALFSQFLPHLPSFHPPQPSLIRPAQFSSSHSIRARFSLPVKHALSRPFSPPRLPKPPVVPARVTQLGLGTARTFHSGRPIFQNMVDNVPIATRALWEAEWDVKTKKKEVRRMRRLAKIKPLRSQEMLKPISKRLIAESESHHTSEINVYFPTESTPVVTSHLLVPLAPTPTARLPLPTHSNDGSAHPLLPISDLAYIHTSHRLHSLRVSTLFARLDTANVWDDPGVNVDAYAFGPRHDTNERQCTVLRVTFRGWNAARVRVILGDDTEEWFSLQETGPDGLPTLAPLSDARQDVYSAIHSHSLSLEVDSSEHFEIELDEQHDVSSPLPVRARASPQHDLVFPTLDFSSAFSDTADNLSQHSQLGVFCAPTPS